MIRQNIGLLDAKLAELALTVRSTRNRIRDIQAAERLNKQASILTDEDRDTLASALNEDAGSIQTAYNEARNIFLSAVSLEKAVG